MTRGIVFFHVGPQYTVPLAVAIATLRKFCDAPVAIICDPGPGRATAMRIAADKRLGEIQVRPRSSIRERFLQREAWAYLYKTRLPECSPFAETLLLDSDILITGDVGPLWPQEAHEAVLTKRNGGRHQNLKARLRCRKWGHVDAARAARSQDRSYPYPPINTGIMAFGSDSGAFQAEWRRLAEANPIHSCDEQAAQLIYPDFQVRLVDYRFNASVIHDLGLEDVRIWHGVDRRFWKDARGRKLWLPVAQEIVAQNLGNAADLLGTFAWAAGRVFPRLQSAAKG